MYKIRGDKISMIFQDPLSALNPIVKIGPQIIEALILKNKASRKMARKEFNQKLEVLKQNMYESFNSDQKGTIDNLIQAYDNFSIKSLEIETDYNQSHAEATEIISKLEDFLFRASKHQNLNVADYSKTFLNNFEKVTNITASKSNRFNLIFVNDAIYICDKNYKNTTISYIKKLKVLKKKFFL